MSDPKEHASSALKNQTSGADPTRSESTVYGPVKSWRVGRSLGVDLIQEISTCSFNCIYCQLGDIQRVTAERRIYVPTAKILADLEAVDWAQVDIVTVSGSGEPTLAKNIGEVLRAVRERHGKPTCVLTNAFHFHDPDVRRQLCEADEVAAKLDAATDETLRTFNRPAEPITVRRIVDGIKLFQSEYEGRLCTQTMLMPINLREIEDIARLIGEIRPAEAQLNTPRRFYPMVWRQENRGRHVEQAPDYPHRRLKAVERDPMREIRELMQRVSGVPVVSVYGPD